MFCSVSTSVDYSISVDQIWISCVQNYKYPFNLFTSGVTFIDLLFGISLKFLITLNFTECITYPFAQNDPDVGLVELDCLVKSIAYPLYNCTEESTHSVQINHFCDLCSFYGPSFSNGAKRPNFHLFTIYLKPKKIKLH